MRFIFKTDYSQDIRLFPFGGTARFWLGLALYALIVAGLAHASPMPLGPGHWFGIAAVYAVLFGAVLLRQNADGEGGHAAFWYGLLGVGALTAPFILDLYFTSQITFVYVYGIAGVGLILLLGMCGQISLGHAAFMACGAYTAGLLQAQGFDLLVTLPAAVLLSAALGVVIGLPALRMTGIYLAFATYAFAFIVEEILARWDNVTGGNMGFVLSDPSILGYTFDSEAKMYYLALALFVLTLLAGLNIRRSSTGRAFMAIRDSETAAEAMGVNLAVYKTTAFAISAGMAGLAGAIYAHLLFFISPEGFTILLSINLLVLAVIGGLASMHGALFGAAFIVVLPQAISLTKDSLPSVVGQLPGLEAGIFGLIIILFVIFEPMGIHGRWMKIKTYFQLFPLYKKGTFKRQKSYMVSERNR
ncbi:branched-chain amino acid ABC transporter permease [Parvibaculum sp.]|uniref:branched-chain amino acid ABC transporter permease n=1 Tax=Parvibaculum sp. TaxID=2024848 RepID=UPI003919B497